MSSYSAKADSKAKNKVLKLNFIETLAGFTFRKHAHAKYRDRKKMIF